MRSEAEIACALGKDTIDATPRALNFDGGHRRDAVPGTAPGRWREGRRSSRDLVLGPTPARWRGSWRRLASSRSPLDATQVFCAGSPCDGISGNNRYRKASIVDHPTSGLVSFVGEWYEKLTARAEQQDEPFITILENVGSMFLSVREELNDVLRQDVNRYIVDEMLSEAPRGNATSGPTYFVSASIKFRPDPLGSHRHRSRSSSRKLSSCRASSAC